MNRAVTYLLGPAVYKWIMIVASTFLFLGGLPGWLSSLGTGESS